MNRTIFVNILATGLFLLALLAPLENGLLLAPNLFKYLLSSPIIILLLSLYFMNKGFTKHCYIIKTPVNYLGLAFLLWALVSIIWAQNTHNAWILWLQYLMAFLVFFLVLNTLRNKQDVVKILLAIFLSGVVVSFVGILQYLFDFSIIRQAKEPASFFGNRNMAAHFIVLSLPLSLGLAIDTSKTVHKMLYCAGSLMMIIFLFFTGASAGLLAFSIQILLLTFLVIFLIQKKSRLKIKRMIPIILVGLVILTSFILYSEREKVTEIVYAQKEEENTKIRIRTWKNTLAMIHDRPISGVGLANWDIYYPLYYNRVVKATSFSEQVQLKNAHNDYLTILSELGVIGFSILLTMALFIMTRTWRILKNPHNTMHYLIFSLALSLAGFLVNASFTFPLSMYLPPVIILVYFAVIVFASNEVSGENKKPKSERVYQLSEKSALFIGIIGFVICIYYFYNNIRHIKAEDFYFQAEILEGKKNWQHLHKVALQSYNLNPNRVRISAYVGQAKMNLGQTQEAIKYFTQALSLAPYNINTMSFFAGTYIAAGDHKNAEKMYLRALNIYPDWAKAHKNIGVLYLNNLKQPKEGIKHLKIALKLDPDIHQGETIRKLINSNAN